ncbi:MAG: putative membrane protein, partial [Planctomycetota bacterium]
NIGSVLILNAEFMARLSIVVCTLICSWLFQKDRARAGWQIVETVAQVGLAVLLAWEFMDQFRFSIDEGHTRAGALSLAWSIQAISLIAVGLRTQSSMRRKTGLVLFAVVIAKILLSDTVNLDAIGRILSFVGTGLFLLLGSYLYNRFESHVADKPRD